MTTKRQKPRYHWSGGFYADEFGPGTDVPFPGIGALKATFPVYRVLTRSYPARVKIIAVAQQVPMPAGVAEGMADTLRCGGAVAIFAANHADLATAVAVIEAAIAVAAIARGSAPGSRR